jgi:pimeloyl-ACP methyl ester carboxylesterase
MSGHKTLKSFSLSVVWLLALGWTLNVEAARVPEPNVRVGDGRVSAFYTWEKDIPEQPGLLLRKETLESVVGLAQAANQYRILFTSTDGITGKDPITVSGAVFFPKGHAPAGGWPVVAWGHGTLGVADVCAPSWKGRSLRDLQYLNTWLSQGYAVVATDYQGIGVPGFNPQFNNRSNSYTLLDSVRAAQKEFSDISNHVLLVGQSQGGSAVVAAASYAKTYAPEVGVKGVIGTGIVYSRKASDQQNASAIKIDVNAKFVSYAFFHDITKEALDKTFKPEEIYTDKALALLDQARVGCLVDVASDANFLDLRIKDAYKHPEKNHAYDAPHDDVSKPFPTVKLDVPLFIGVGDRDGLLTAANHLAKDACEAGTDTEFHVYKGADHSGAVNQSLVHSLVFAKKAIAGNSPVSECKK